MKLNDTKVSVQSNLAESDYEVVMMDFHKEANGFLLNNLIKAYKDPYVAALREYTSNARDAHRKAGLNRPIEVSLPDSLSPVLTIRDFGIGLDREELKGFGQFGKSDKRDSNEYTGGFGLGSKSGLAVAAQFTVTSVKGNKRNTVIVGRNAQGLPNMTFLPEQEVTGEETGTLVSIPTSETWRFKNAIEDNFFMGWAEGTILVDDKFPAERNNVYNTDQYVVLGNDLGWKLGKNLNKRQYGLGRGAVALVNGVKYDIDLSMVENINVSIIQNYLSEIIVNLDNGEVEIHPSRESLIYDARTRKFITDRVNALVKQGRKVYEDEVNKATSIREALQIRAKAISFGFGDEDFLYRGKPMNLTVNEKIKGITITRAQVGYGGSRYGLQATKDLETFEGLVNNKFHHIINRKSVLVVGAAEPKSMGARNRVQHTEANSAAVWAKATADLAGTDPKEYDVYFTNLSAKKVSQMGHWVLGAFTQIIQADVYAETVAAHRREVARLARLGREKIAATPPNKSEVRVLKLDTCGGGYYRSVVISDLDATRKHILLKNDATELVNNARSALLTKIGYSNHRTLSAVLSYMAGKGGYTFILANKNANTDDYASVIPNFSEDLPKAIEEAVKVTVKGKSEITKRAILDRNVNAYGWAMNFPKAKLPLVEDKKVRAWIEAMSPNQPEGEEFLALIRKLAEENRAFEKTAEKAVIKSKIEVSPAERFALLNSFGRYATPNWDAAVEYLNVFSKLSA